MSGRAAWGRTCRCLPGCRHSANCVAEQSILATASPCDLRPAYGTAASACERCLPLPALSCGKLFRVKRALRSGALSEEPRAGRLPLLTSRSPDCFRARLRRGLVATHRELGRTSADFQSPYGASGPLVGDAKHRPGVYLGGSARGTERRIISVAVRELSKRARSTWTGFRVLIRQGVDGPAVCEPCFKASLR